MYRRLGAVLLFSAAAIAGPSLPAHASSLHCGDTISADVVLGHNLNCTGDALHVQVATGQTIHIDLNRHRIKGDGTGIAISAITSGPFSGSLAVTDGTITGFSAALLGPTLPEEQLSELTVDNVHFRSNGSWLPTRFRPKTTIEDSEFIDTGLGGADMDHQSLTVRNSKFVRSSIQSSSESYTYIYDSTFLEAGFSAGVVSNVVATGNTFRDCDTAILISDVFQGGTTTVENNRFLGCQTGVNFNHASGPVSVQNNSFVENSGTAMVFTLPLSGLTADIAGNRFQRNGGDGLSGGGPQIGSGVTIVRVADNLAVGNAGHGINLVNVTDGGGNVARGNATAPDCIGVTCTKH
jgi:hypothetical protein